MQGNILASAAQEGSCGAPALTTPDGTKRTVSAAAPNGNPATGDAHMHSILDTAFSEHGDEDDWEDTAFNSSELPDFEEDAHDTYHLTVEGDQQLRGKSQLRIDLILELVAGAVLAGHSHMELTGMHLSAAGDENKQKRSRPRVSKEDKERAVLVHRANLLCLLGRGQLMDVAASDPLVQVPQQKPDTCKLTCMPSFLHKTASALLSLTRSRFMFPHVASDSIEYVLAHSLQSCLNSISIMEVVYATREWLFVVTPSDGCTGCCSIIFAIGYVDQISIQHKSQSCSPGSTPGMVSLGCERGHFC